MQAKREAVKKWLGTGSINIFGIQFSGKDTQGKRLADWTGGWLLGGGELSRRLADELPAEARKNTEAGQLLPKDVYMQLMPPFLMREEFAGKPLVLSAVGRMHGEEEGINKACNDSGHNIKAVVWLDMDEALVWERWRKMSEVKDREARTDDAESGLRTRIEWYKKWTLPVKQFYSERGLVINVDGSLPPDKVEAEILDGLYRLATRPS